MNTRVRPIALGLVLVAASPASAQAQQLLRTFTGEKAGDKFGSAVAGAGDVNHDARDDVVVGAPFSSGTDGIESGRAYLYSGANGSKLQVYNGENQFDRLGASVSGAGDVAGGSGGAQDGEPDVFIGAPLADGLGPATGRATLFSKTSGSVIYDLDGFFLGDGFGASVAGGGDFEDDGRPDLLVGSPGFDGAAGLDTGAVNLYLGKNGGLLTQLEGETAGDAFGASVAWAGDANGDGFDDLAVGAPGFDGAAGADSGKAYLYAFAGNLAFEGETAGDAFGAAVAGAGDVNLDGRADLVVGAPGFDGAAGADTGKIYVFSGADGSLLFSAEGEAAGDALGSSVSTAGRVDADAKADVAAGAPGFDGAAGAEAGKVYVFSGSTGALYSSVEGEQAGARLGAAVARAGNINGDGKDDLVVGAPGYFKSGSGGGADTGRAYLYSMFVPPPPPGPCATAEGARPTALALYGLPFAGLLLLRARRRIG